MSGWCVSRRKLRARAITIFPTLRKRMGLADTLTARSQMFHASLRPRLEHEGREDPRMCSHVRFPQRFRKGAGACNARN